MHSKILPIGSLEAYKYVIVLSRYEGKILLSRHRARTTWETQGGHVEPGEAPMAAARRELYEESGAAEFDIVPLCDYCTWDDVRGRETGMVFAADIRRLGPIPESEMAEVRAFDALPGNLTYPLITPELFAHLFAQADFSYTSILGRTVHVVIDRPMGSVRPAHGGRGCPVNDGCVPHLLAGDGKAQGACVLGVDCPVDAFDGVVAAVVHRKGALGDKWVVCPEGYAPAREEILETVDVAERHFDIELEMKA